jgi:uncharacterized protein YjcR
VERKEKEMGAPKGNTNALKHGLYAKHFSEEEINSLRRMEPEDLRHEIHMMRVAVNNVFKVQVRLRKLLDEAEKKGELYDPDRMAKVTNSLAQAMTALNTTLRTHALFQGKDATVTDALDEALDGMAIFLDKKYLVRVDEDEEGETPVQ